MSNTQYSNSNYSDLTQTTKSSKSLEYDVVASITARLKSTKSEKSDYPSLVHALDTNRRMWSLIATSVADSENSYPNELKARLFYLFEFTIHHTQKVLSGDSEIDALIDINTALLRGLKGTGL